MAKKTFAVDVFGATVWFSKDKRNCFLASSGLIYLLDAEDRREFSTMKFREGELVWLYVAKEISRLVSIVEAAGERVEDLPPVEPVEVDV
jgi:hypothetical protein